MPHDQKGREIPDPTPLAIPAGLKKPESMQDMIRRFVRIEASRIAQAEGYESFDEADDFEVDDAEPDDVNTPYGVPWIEMAPEAGPEGPESLDGAPVIPTQPETATKAPAASGEVPGAKAPQEG